MVLRRTSTMVVSAVIIGSFFSGVLLVAPASAAQLKSNYTGTFDNLTLNSSGPLSFSNVTSADGKITGGDWFGGPPNTCAAGPIKGKVSGGDVVITATTGNGCSKLRFKGTFTPKSHHSMAGTFKVQTPSGVEAGTWVVTPTS